MGPFVIQEQLPGMSTYREVSVHPDMDDALPAFLQVVRSWTALRVRGKSQGMGRVKLRLIRPNTPDPNQKNGLTRYLTQELAVVNIT